MTYTQKYIKLHNVESMYTDNRRKKNRYLTDIRIQYINKKIFTYIHIYIVGEKNRKMDTKKSVIVVVLVFTVVIGMVTALDSLDCNRKVKHKLTRCFIKDNAGPDTFDAKTVKYMKAVMKIAHKKMKVEFPKDYDVKAQSCKDLLAGFATACRCNKEECPGIFAPDRKKTAFMKCGAGKTPKETATVWALPKKCMDNGAKKEVVYVPHCTCKKKKGLRKLIGMFNMEWKKPFQMCKGSDGRLISC